MTVESFRDGPPERAEHQTRTGTTCAGGLESVPSSGHERATEKGGKRGRRGRKEAVDDGSILSFVSRKETCVVFWRKERTLKVGSGKANRSGSRDGICTRRTVCRSSAPFQCHWHHEPVTSLMNLFFLAEGIKFYFLNTGHHSRRHYSSPPLPSPASVAERLAPLVSRPRGRTTPPLTGDATARTPPTRAPMPTSTST